MLSIKHRQDTKYHQHIMALGLLTSFALMFLWLGSNGVRPVSDAGGYVNMLRYFLKTGQVDYMNWSQPTFIGVVVLAAPWSLLFGTGTASLQSLGVLYGLATIGGLYLFLVHGVRPVVAALLCSSLLCFSEFLPNVPSFMTDVPYVAYTVWFLVVHRAQEIRYSRNRSGSRTLWFVWGLLFLLAALTRSFALVLMPLFGLQWLLATRQSKAQTQNGGDTVLAGRLLFRQRSFFLSLALSVAALLLVRVLGRNAIPLSEITVIPEVLREHHWTRFNVRALCIISVQTVLMLLPALLVFAARQHVQHKKSLHFGNAIVGLGMLVVAVYFWKKGLLPPLFTVPYWPVSARIIELVQLTMVPLAAVLTARLLRSILVARNATEDASTQASTLQALFVLIVTNVLILPFLQHPLLRHLLPAFVAVIMAIGMLTSSRREADISHSQEPNKDSNRSKKLLIVAAACAIVLLGSMNMVGAHATRQMNAAQWDMAESLRRQGVPTSQIAGGWAWFCSYHLNPGQPQNESYVTRFNILESNATYRVVYSAENNALHASARVLKTVVIASPYGPQNVNIVKRDTVSHAP